MDFNRECNQRKLMTYLNPFCTKYCVNNLIEGKLDCECADSGIYSWKWQKHEGTSAILSKDNREVVFHPVYSAGTAVLQGTAPLEHNIHHYWEVKMLSNLYGTDVMVGVGTSDIELINWRWRYRFFSFLGSDKQSWGFSYNGCVQHNNQMHRYGLRFGLGSLIGVHLDMCTGTLEFYLNRKPLGIAFRGLKEHTLYPMICSTAAHSAMKMTCAMTIEPSLQLRCLQVIVKDKRVFTQFRSVPGLRRVYEKKFFWLLPTDVADIKKTKGPGKLVKPTEFRSPMTDDIPLDINFGLAQNPRQFAPISPELAMVFSDDSTSSDSDC